MSFGLHSVRWLISSRRRKCGFHAGGGALVECNGPMMEKRVQANNCSALVLNPVCLSMVEFQFQIQQHRTDLSLSISPGLAESATYTQICKLSIHVSSICIVVIRLRTHWHFTCSRNFWNSDFICFNADTRPIMLVTLELSAGCRQTIHLARATKASTWSLLKNAGL